MRQSVISLQSLARAIGYSLVRKRAIERAEQAKAEAHALRVEREAAAWRAELERRRIEALDLDGSRAAARQARDEQLEQERLDFLTAQLVRRTA